MEEKSSKKDSTVKSESSPVKESKSTNKLPLIVGGVAVLIFIVLGIVGVAFLVLNQGPSELSSDEEAREVYEEAAENFNNFDGVVEMSVLGITIEYDGENKIAYSNALGFESYQTEDKTYTKFGESWSITESDNISDSLTGDLLLAEDTEITYIGLIDCPTDKDTTCHEMAFKDAEAEGKVFIDAKDKLILSLEGSTEDGTTAELELKYNSGESIEIPQDVLDNAIDTTITYSVGEAATIDGVEVTINSFTEYTPDTSNEFISVEEGTKLYAADITVTNVSSDSSDVANALNFNLSNDLEERFVSTGLTRSFFFEKEPVLASENLAVEESVSGNITFSVADNIEGPLYLFYSPTFLTEIKFEVRGE